MMKFLCVLVLLVLVTHGEEERAVSASAAEFGDVDGPAAALEIILLFPSEEYVVTSSKFLVEVLLRCSPRARDCSASQACLPSTRARVEHCSHLEKTVTIWVNGVQLGEKRTHKVERFLVAGIPDGENELTVQVEMESFPTQSLSTWFDVNASSPPYGHDVSLTACAKKELRRSYFGREEERVAGDTLWEDSGCSRGANCSAHGKCFRDVCLCDADFVGDFCEVDLRAYFRPPKEHLPAHDPGMDRRTCVRNHRWTTEAEAFRESLTDIYEGRSSAAGKGEAAEVFENQIYDSGLGAQLLFASTALIHSMRSGRAARWTAADHVFTHFRSCGSMGPSDPMFECFFLPLYPDNGELCRARSEAVPRGRFNEALDAFPALGSFLLLAEVMAALTRPTLRLAASLRRLKQAVAFRPGMLALHVRGGETCFFDWARKGCVGVAEHVARVRTMLATYPGAISGVFLATDSQGVVDDVTRMLHGVTTVVSNPNVEHGLGGPKIPISHLLATGQLDRRYATEGIVLDMLLLGECSFLVGNLESAVSRIALLLMTSRLGYVPPFLSVQAAVHT